MRYALYRWVLPRLGAEPLAIKHLFQEAWPQVSALTAARDYSNGVEVVHWDSNGDDDGSEALREYGEASCPVVIKGFHDAKWTLGWVKQQIGDIEAAVRVGDYASAPGEPESVVMKVAEFIDYISGKGKFPYPDRLADGVGPYIGNMDFPGLANQLPRPKSHPKTTTTNFWLGGADSQTPLHCHQHGDAFVMQLIGRRSVMFVPPHQAPLVGCVPVNVNICTASFDPFSPDPERFPGADLVHAVRADLEPGDALLIPGFWFHAIKLDAPSMSATLDREQMPWSLGGGPVDHWKNLEYSRGW